MDNIDIAGLVIGLLIMWPVGYFFVLLVSGGVRKHWWANTLQALLGLAAGALILWIMSVSAETDRRNYNNGICTECGGEYKFSGAAGKHNSNHYFYTCDTCDHTIRVESIQN